MRSNSLRDFKVRAFTEYDSVEEITGLLHLAYKKLSLAGLKYLASHQATAITKQRIEKGKCFLALSRDKIIGTITYYSPYSCSGCEWYDQPEVASYGQFAVHPEFQGKGIGNALIKIAEYLAKKDNAKEITVDTSERAQNLIDFYMKRGYRLVGYAQWKEVNYKSVLLSKSIPQ